MCVIPVDCLRVLMTFVAESVLTAFRLVSHECCGFVAAEAVERATQTKVIHYEKITRLSNLESCIPVTDKWKIVCHASFCDFILQRLQRHDRGVVREIVEMHSGVRELYVSYLGLYITQLID